MREMLKGNEDLTDRELRDLIMKDINGENNNSDEEGSLSTLLTMIGYPSSSSNAIPTDEVPQQPHDGAASSSSLVGPTRSSPEEMISSITLLDPGHGQETYSRWNSDLRSLHQHRQIHHHLEPHTGMLSEDHGALVEELLREESEVSSSTNINQSHRQPHHHDTQYFSASQIRQPNNIHHHFGHSSNSHRSLLGYHHHSSDSFLPGLNVTQPTHQTPYAGDLRAHPQPQQQYLDLSNGYHHHHHPQHQRFYPGDLSNFAPSPTELPDSSTSHLAPQLLQGPSSSWSDSLLDLALTLNCDPEPSSSFLNEELVVRKDLTSPTSTTTTTASSLTDLTDEEDEEGEDSEFEASHPTPSVVSPPPPLVLVKRKVGRPKKNAEDRRRKDKKTGRLWEFIRDLLKNPEYCPSLVRWENVEEGHFRFVNSEKVAQLWGQIKGNPRMTYEKLSRAMRYYYKNHVFEPVLGRRLVYKFGYNATNWKPLNVHFPNPLPVASSTNSLSTGSQSAYCNGYENGGVPGPR